MSAKEGETRRPDEEQDPPERALADRNGTNLENFGRAAEGEETETSKRGELKRKQFAEWHRKAKRRKPGCRDEDRNVQPPDDKARRTTQIERQKRDRKQRENDEPENFKGRRPDTVVALILVGGRDEKAICAKDRSEVEGRQQQ